MRREFLNQEGGRWSREDEFIDRIKKEMRGETMRTRAIMEAQNHVIAELLVHAEALAKGQEEVKHHMKRTARGGHVPLRSPLLSFATPH